MADKPYDLAVVGAGTGGCIVAARIAQNGGHPTTGEPLHVHQVGIGDLGIPKRNGRGVCPAAEFLDLGNGLLLLAPLT